MPLTATLHHTLCAGHRTQDSVGGQWMRRTQPKRTTPSRCRFEMLRHKQDEFSDIAGGPFNLGT